MPLSWPNWRPERDLKASHLAGMEDFLLARANLMESGLHGVESFDYGASMKLSGAESGNAVLQVWNLRGVTPTGQPVVVTEDEVLEQTLGLAGPDEPCLDVLVGVSRVEADAPENKIWLEAREVADEGKAARLVPGTLPNALYLGRYRFDAAGKATIVDFPLVRRFSGLRPCDEQWKRWTEPLRSVIEEWWGKVQPLQGPGSIEMALATEVAKLRLAWATAPLNEVRERLYLVRSLDERIDTQQPGFLAAALQPFPRATEIGNALPASLARVLAPSVTRSFAEVIKDLLCPVTVRVPLRRFDEWAGHFSNLERFGISCGDGESDLEGVALVLEGRIHSGRVVDDWSRLVALSTIWTARKFVDRNWGEDTLYAFLEHPTDDIPMSVARLLDRLIAGTQDAYITATHVRLVSGTPEQSVTTTEGVSGSSPAAPLGVYRIATALPKELKTDAGRCAIRQVTEYLNMVEQKKAPERSRNAAFDHIHVRWTDKPEAPAIIRGKNVWAAGAPKRFAGGKSPWRDMQNDLRIVIVGPEGSGRTTLRDGIMRLLREDAPLQIEGVRPRSLKHAEGQTADSPRDPGSADVLLGKTHFRVSVIDTSGIRDADRLGEVVRRGDLVVAAIPPEAVAGERVDLMKELASLVTRGLGTDRHSLVAIAYTKADEYGILDERGLRVFWSSRPFEIYYEAQRNWNEFVRSLKRGGIVVPPIRDRRWREEEPDVTIFGRDEWGDTRALVVNASRVVWEPLLPPGGAENILNGYFVSCEPIDEFYAPHYRRGYGQMLADYFALVGQG